MANIGSLGLILWARILSLWGDLSVFHADPSLASKLVSRDCVGNEVRLFNDEQHCNMLSRTILKPQLRFPESFFIK
ncbi:hypothetical protein J6590_057118 [Homalodisca vitripennis]|nr:hypothetical protein J6590_057118 [Homalodisca vitripennis]